MIPCVECGAEDVRLIDGTCTTCFLAKTPLLSVPDILDVELCAHCDARLVGSKWVDPAQGMELPWIREDAVREALRMHQRVQEPYIQMDESPQDDKNFQYSVYLEGIVDGVPVTSTTTTRVRQRKNVCDRCSRMYGNFYAAIIQLRATERDVSPAELERAHKIVGNELDRQRASGNRFAFLTKSGPEHGGFDYYIGDIEGARQISRVLAKKLDCSIQESAKLVGRREGDDVHRVTFLVRIRLFSMGDFAVDQEGRPVQVIAVNRGRAQVVDLLRQFRTRMDDTRLKRLGGPELLENCVVVSRTETELQVLDPKTYRTVEVPIGRYENPGETVGLLRHEELLYTPGWGNPEWEDAESPTSGQ